MSRELFNGVVFGSLGSLGARAPYLMRSVVTHADLLSVTERKLNVAFTPMVSYVSFKNSNSVKVDNVSITNVAPGAVSLMKPTLGNGRVEAASPVDKQFGFYLYPTKKFTVSISQEQIVISKTVEAVNANSLVVIDI